MNVTSKKPQKRELAPAIHIEQITLQPITPRTAAMARTMWKGAISFGLLHAPVGLYPVSKQDEIDFDWLHRKSLKPVGYKRVVKDTGEEVDKEGPTKGGEKVYALLREAEVRCRSGTGNHRGDGRGAGGNQQRGRPHRRRKMRLRGRACRYRCRWAGKNWSASAWPVATLPDRLAMPEDDPWKDYVGTRQPLGKAARKSSGSIDAQTSTRGTSPLTKSQCTPMSVISSVEQGKQ